MKKLLLSILTCLAILPVGATNLEELTGSYTGTLSVKLNSDDDNGVSLDPEDGKLPVIPIYIEEEVDKNTMKFSLNNFSFMGIPVGDIIVSDVTIDETGTIHAPQVILDKRGDDIMSLGYLPTTLTGSIVNGKALFKIKVEWNQNGKDKDGNWLEPSQWNPESVIPVFVTFNGVKDVTDNINKYYENTIKTIYSNNKLSLTGAEITGFSIYNINGALVDNYNSYFNIIDLTKYPLGVYLVKINTNLGTITRKVYRK
ncbi:MAG: calycin-like domain-containing protein [Bacteroidales bacterium]